MTKRDILERFDELGYGLCGERKECFFLTNEKKGKCIKIDNEKLTVKIMDTNEITAVKATMKEIRLIYELLKYLRDEEQ